MSIVTMSQETSCWVVFVVNRQSLIPLEASRFESCAREIFRREQLGSAELTITFVDDEEIHRLNREFLSHDYPTDVLSFLLEDPTTGASRWIGEIIVSTTTAMRVAREVAVHVDDELLLYVTHGVLHLCGYDDTTESARKQMRLQEREVLASFGLSPSGFEEGDQ